MLKHPWAAAQGCVFISGGSGGLRTVPVFLIGGGSYAGFGPEGPAEGLEIGIGQLFGYFRQGKPVQTDQFFRFFNLAVADVALQGGGGARPEQMGKVKGTVAQTVRNAGDGERCADVPVNVTHNPVDQQARIFRCVHLLTAGWLVEKIAAGPDEHLAETGFDDDLTALGGVVELVQAFPEAAVKLILIPAGNLPVSLIAAADFGGKLLAAFVRQKAHVGVKKRFILGGADGVLSMAGRDDQISGGDSHLGVVQRKAAFAGNHIADFTAALLVRGNFITRFQAQLANLEQVQCFHSDGLGEKRLIVMEPPPKAVVLHRDPSRSALSIYANYSKY